MKEVNKKEKPTNSKKEETRLDPHSQEEKQKRGTHIILKKKWSVQPLKEEIPTLGEETEFHSQGGGSLIIFHHIIVRHTPLEKMCAECYWTKMTGEDINRND